MKRCPTCGSGSNTLGIPNVSPFATRPSPDAKLMVVSGKLTWVSGEQASAMKAQKEEDMRLTRVRGVASGLLGQVGKAAERESEAALARAAAARLQPEIPLLGTTAAVKAAEAAGLEAYAARLAFAGGKLGTPAGAVLTGVQVLYEGYRVLHDPHDPRDEVPYNPAQAQQLEDQNPSDLLGTGTSRKPIEYK